MSIKKTILISIIFHLILFSAALLFSAGLLRGIGNNSDEKVFFVRLAVDNREHSNEIVFEKKKPAQKKVQTVQQKKKNQVASEKPPEILKTKVALKKPPTLREETATENIEHQQAHEGKSTDEQYAHDEAQMSSDSQYETVHSSLQTPFYESNGFMNDPSRKGLSPSMLELIGNAIERAKSYPMLARKRGIEGTVHVSFRINESGRPDEIEIKKSSGHSILDSATVKVVKKAAPYPYVKSRVEVPVAYRIKK